MGGGGGEGEGKRHQMMQNLFGDQSEEEGEEIDSEHESNPHPSVEGESDGEQGDLEPDLGESEGEIDVVDPREGSEARDCDSDNREEGDKERVTTKRRRDVVVVESKSERSRGKLYESEDEEVNDQTTNRRRSPSEEEEEEKEVAQVAKSDVNIRNAFGSSDDEDGDDVERNEPRSQIEDEEDSEKDLRTDDMLLDDIAPEEDPRYESEDERVEARYKEKPVGPPLEVVIPFFPPPGDPSKMNMIKVSNIMRVDPKPFDAKTFVEEETFETDAAGNKRIRLLNNIVRHRIVKRRDGKTSSESNARFVKWSDGSLQLLIGNEVLDVMEQDAQHDQNHLFIKHEKGILQSQGKVMKKMRFIQSSLTSNSHKLLAALVESRHKKGYKVKNCVTDIDPEREKEKREKAESQNLKASTKLSQAREKIKRKYSLPVERRQLSTGYLEDALEEDEETDHYGSHRSYEEELEAEAQRERRIMNAKKVKQSGHKSFSGRSSTTSGRSSRRQVEYSESEREEEESEYETEEAEEEMSPPPPPPRKRVKEPKDEYEEEEEANRYSEEDEEEEKKKKSESGRKRKEIESDDEESPPRKAPTHRRMAMMVYDSDED